MVLTVGYHFWLFSMKLNIKKNVFVIFGWYVQYVLKKYSVLMFCTDMLVMETFIVVALCFYV